MRIAPDQVKQFLDGYFAGRDAELRAINSVLAMQRLAVEQRSALECAGFTNACDDRVAQACYEWAAAKSPYVDGFNPPSAAN